MTNPTNNAQTEDDWWREDAARLNEMADAANDAGIVIDVPVSEDLEADDDEAD